MVEKVTLTRVSATDKKADGTILKNKFGEFFRLGIQTEEHKDSSGNPVWINGFSKRRPTWNVGDVIDVEITEEVYNGEKRLQFRVPKKEDSLEARIVKLEEAVFGANKNTEGTDEQPSVDDSF